MPQITLRNLSILNYGNGFTHWHYRTNDTRDVVLEDPFYWTGIPNMTVGDLITIVGGPDEGPCWVAQTFLESCYNKDNLRCRASRDAFTCIIKPVK